MHRGASALADTRRCRSAAPGAGRQAWGFVAAVTVAGAAIAVLALAAQPAAAQSTWSGSGSVNFTSTPSQYGPCTGSGTSQIDLSGDPSNLQGTLTVDLTSVSSACSGSFTMGPISDSVSGSMSGSDLYLTDSYGDSLTGTLSGSYLTLSFTTQATNSGGATCVAFCTTTYTMDMTGSGDLGAAGGAGFGGSFDPTDPTMAVAGTGALFGFVGMGLAASSLPGRIPSPRGRSSARSAMGCFPMPSGGGHFSEIRTLGPQYSVAPQGSSGDAPPAPISGPGEGQAITGGGAGVAPPAPPPPPNDICSFISVNGVPLNPNYGDYAQVQYNPRNGRWQYRDQHTGEWFWAFPS